MTERSASTVPGPGASPGTPLSPELERVAQAAAQ